MKNNKKHNSLLIDPIAPPNVLLLGNGMLKLGNHGTSWNDLLERIKMRDDDISVTGIPYAMQPEVYCGVDVEEIQRQIAKNLSTNPTPHSLLEELLSLPFDAIITTNYTYEIEMILSGGKWTKTDRKNSFYAMDGNSRVNHNTFVCNVVHELSGRIIPVFHIHGEIDRKHSIILSYYSYAKSVFKLLEYNKKLGNAYFEHQQECIPIQCGCWLDYFVLGNVWSVGFGLDVSEFDVWWAIERKAREVAGHGRLNAFIEIPDDGISPQKILLDAMQANCMLMHVHNDYESFYSQIIRDIKNRMNSSD